MYRIDDRGQRSAYTIEVYGKQWWWEVHYTQPDTVAGVVTANEIYIPVNTRVRIELMSSNVIHSFYVPQLAGKMDVMPGHTNVMSVEADKPGMYYGECAEFCGESHAFMRFKIIAVPQDQFDVFINGWTAGRELAGGIDGAEWRRRQRAGRVRSLPRLPPDRRRRIIPAVSRCRIQPMRHRRRRPQPNQILGPNLSMLACRTTTGRRHRAERREHLRDWLHNPGGVKQGNYMATMITRRHAHQRPDRPDRQPTSKTLHPRRAARHHRRQRGQGPLAWRMRTRPRRRPIRVDDRPTRPSSSKCGTSHDSEQTCTGLRPGTRRNANGQHRSTGTCHCDLCSDRRQARSPASWSWITTIDHKRIGILYGVTAFLFFLVGGLEALLIRAPARRAEQRRRRVPARYNELFTMHGTTMIFLAIMPLSVAFFNYVVPLQIGARDVAFPRLNAFCYWTFLAGAHHPQR